jgi:hypothetical protein
MISRLGAGHWVVCMALILPLFGGCNFVLKFDDEPAEGSDEDWGPFKLGMSVSQVKAIIKAKTGSDPKIERLPGLPWDTIFFEDRMITIKDGVLFCVLRSEHDERSFRIDDLDEEASGDDDDH